MRPVVSYDDITAPQAPPVPQTGPPSSFPQPPPAKKRKTNQRPANGRPQQHFQHWDDPGSNAAQMSYDDVPVGAGTGEEGQEDDDEEDEESRELTHDEIWDDSALVDAWESAMAEYEVRRRISSHRPGRMLTVRAISLSMGRAVSGRMNPSKSRLCESASSAYLTRKLTGCTQMVQRAPIGHQIKGQGKRKSEGRGVHRFHYQWHTLSILPSSSRSWTRSGLCPTRFRNFRPDPRSLPRRTGDRLRIPARWPRQYREPGRGILTGFVGDVLGRLLDGGVSCECLKSSSAYWHTTDLFR